MFYFSKFPTTTYYPLIAGRGPVIATDITRRFAFSQLVRDQAIVFYDYPVRDGERPDIIADKYYKDTTLDWLVLLPNEIADPYFQWYMSTTQFESYIRHKYGSVDVAQQQINRYEWIRQQSTTVQDDDGARIRVPERSLTVDYTTYLSLPTSDTRVVSNYDHEVNVNESHRKIVLVDAAYVPTITDSYRKLFA